MKTLRQPPYSITPEIMKAIATELEILLGQGLIFVEKDERQRLNEVDIFGNPPSLCNPARLLVAVISETIFFTKTPSTDADIHELITETHVCADVLTKVFEIAAVETAKKPTTKIRSNHIKHIVRNGLIPWKTPVHRKELIRRVTIMAGRMGRN